ncbi:MAG: peptidyl-tRNA hydrolase Pth2 [Candidatus Thermoplasmatota archaeon]|jgi:PTH2 family peptidyl-tRNA hydrolase|nr:peptidyl-tRNA hydrolase Pth2 [Candidatus Thermoplasmatota archaeon]MCL5800017.1 peptidyl-tRNA hydrolase Pth2 [Candidatus Thermoplasmatota archaeon]
MVTEYKMVIVVRKDLDLGRGKIAAQVAHAAVHCALHAEKNDKSVFRQWNEQGGKKIVVRVDSLDDIYRLKDQADKKGITNSLITDAGKTQVEPDTVTCLGLGPAEASLLDEMTGGLSLL